MAVRRESIYWVDTTDDRPINNEIETQPWQEIAYLILDFLNSSEHVPRRRYIIARRQLLSLYRRMKYHPENKALCEGYIDQIKQIIYLERGNKK